MSESVALRRDRGSCTPVHARGQETRKRLLEAVSETLGEALAARDYSIVKVRVVARGAGVSAATFYQYFEDLDAALAELAQEAVDATATARLAALLAPKEASLEEVMTELVEDFRRVYRTYAPVLTVVDYKAAAGQVPFTALRRRFLAAPAAVIEQALIRAASHDADPGRTRATAEALTGMLVTAVAHHRPGRPGAGWKTTRETLIHTLTHAVTPQQRDTQD